MADFTIDVSRSKTSRINLGIQGENIIEHIIFNISAWIEEFGEGDAYVYAQRKGDENPYPVALDMDLDAGTATWTLNATDTAVKGKGKAQLVYVVDEDGTEAITDDEIKKTRVFSTTVQTSLVPASEENPDAYETWLEVLGGYTARIEAAEQDLEDYVQANTIADVTLNGSSIVEDRVAEIPLASSSENGAMASADKAKLDGIEAGAEANVQSDWNQTNTSADNFIKNKPTIPTVPVTDVQINGTSILNNKVANIPAIRVTAGGGYGVVPNPPFPDSTGDVRILTDSGWRWAVVDAQEIASNPNAFALNSAISGALAGKVSDVINPADDSSLVENGVVVLPIAGDQDTYGYGMVWADYDEGTHTIGLGFIGADEVYLPQLVNRGTGIWHIRTEHLPDATTTDKGAMSAADKAKLNGIEAGAEVNTISGIEGESPISVDSTTDTPVISHETSGVTADTYAAYSYSGGYYIPSFTVDEEGHVTAATNLGTSIQGVRQTSANYGLMSKEDWASAVRAYSNNYLLLAGQTSASFNVYDENSPRTSVGIVDVVAFDASTYEPVMVDWTVDTLASAQFKQTYVTLTVSIAEAYEHDIRIYPTVTYRVMGM